MNERQLLAALRARDPRGVAELYDSYAEGLYDYSWWLLRDHGTAREALHDTLLAGGVLADALRSPERLRPWLYGLIRAECLRRSPATPRTTGDADAALDATELRCLAWQATEAVPATESDILELHIRHRIEPADLASIRGMSVAAVGELLEQAQQRAGQALRVEMLSRTGPADCPELSDLVTRRERRSRDAREGQGDPGDPGEQGGGAEELDEAIDRHAGGCSSCSGRIPHKVSMTRLMGLLPVVSPPEDLRERVVDAYTEPRLLEYRLLAARRLQPLGRDGFPRVHRGSPRASTGTAAFATVGGLVAAGLCVAAGFAILPSGLLTADGGAGTDREAGAYTEAGSRRSTSIATSARERTLDGPLSPIPGGVRNSGGWSQPARGTGFPAGVLGGIRGRPPSDGGGAVLRGNPRPATTVTTVLDGGGVRARSRAEPPSAGGTADPGSPIPSQGRLRVSTSAVSLGDGRQGSVVLSARGGSAHWSASADMACVGVSPAAGGMDGGERVSVVILLDRNDPGCPASGNAVVTFAEGGPVVRVTWTAPDPSPSPEDPSPSIPEPGTSSPPDPR